MLMCTLGYFWPFTRSIPLHVGWYLARMQHLPGEILLVYHYVLLSLSFKRKWLMKYKLGFRLNLGLQEPHNITWWDDLVLFSMCQVAGIIVVILTKPVQKSTKHNLDKQVDWLYWETPGRKSRSTKYSLDWQFAAFGYTLGSPTRKSEVVLEDLVLKS